MHLRVTLAALLAIGALAAGCGDEDETTTTSSTTTAGATGPMGASGAGGGGSAGLLPAGFAAEANEICAKASKQTNAAFRELFAGQKQPSAAEIETQITDTVVPSIRSQMGRLRDLGEPGKGADELNALLDDAEAALSQLDQDAGSYVESILSGEAEDPFSEIAAQAKALGLTECATG